MKKRCAPCGQIWCAPPLAEGDLKASLHNLNKPRPDLPPRPEKSGYYDLSARAVPANGGNYIHTAGTLQMREAEQSAQLTRMRRIATGLFIAMAVIFVASRLLQSRYDGLSFVTAFAEAAMVGALADWFAVTALFRRPLGLPIPHTAIIPNNKDRIGESVANFLEHNFMTQEVLSEELRQVDFAGSAARWLAVPENSRAVSRQIVSGIPAIFRMIEDQDVQNFMQNTMGRALGNVRFAPFLGELLAILVADRRHQALFDHLIGMASRALEQHRPFIRQKVHERTPRWLPSIIDDKLADRLMEEAQDILEEMRQEDSEWRERFQRAAEEQIDRLRSSPEYEEKIAALIHGTLNHPLFRDYSLTVWHDIKARLLADVGSDDSKVLRQLDRGLRLFSEALLQDEAVREKLNHWIRSFATEAIVNRREVIASLVERVIKKWDADTVSHKFELYVGRDLQYIRINGTLVGGMVGLVLHMVSLAL
jgi:uncharacterized membrane-anchored protein YjiN (DUF445 family)